MLRRIEVRGFKSFAGATALELGPGVNVIVGPNGSGKSNLAEAIVWAMGEQRASRLRASGMGEVVFSGGAGRPAAGLAEVRITLADDHGVPGDAPAETEVHRRVTRAGDATYRLDGTSCRLLDVHEALARRGLGPDALAVIRQGQVETVCAARPAELRAILEEAAGVALSRRRRRRSESRLAKVGERLDRARDLAGELGARRAALERQARAAERAADLETRIAEERRLATAAAAHAAARALGAAEERRDEAAEEAAARGRAAQAAGVAADQAGGRIGRLRDQRAVQEALRQALRAAADRVGDRHEVARERIAEAGARAARRRERAERARRERDDVAGALRAARDRAAEAERVLASRAEEADALRAAHAAREEQARATRAQADADARALADAAAAARRAQEQAAARGRAREAAAQARDALRAQEEVRGLDRLTRRAEVAAERARRGEARRAEAEGRRRDAEARLRAASERRRQAEADASRLAPARGEAPGLAGALRAAPGMEGAVGAALGVVAEAVPADDLPAALAAITGGAPAALVPVPDRAAVPPPPGARPLWEVVEHCPPALRPHLARLLADVWLVDDLADVPPGAPGVAVTAAGDLLRADTGLVTRAGERWARAARHARARERADEARREEAAAGERAAADGRHEDALRRRAAAAQAGAQRAARALAAETARLEARARAIADAEARLADAARACDEAEAELAPARRRQEEAEGTARASAAAAASAADAREAAAQELRAGEAAWQAARGEQAAAGVALAELTERDRALAAAGAPPAVGDTAVAERAAATLGALAAALAERAAEAEEAVRAGSEPLRQAQAEAGRLREQAVQAQDRARRAEADLHEAELALAAARARAEQLGPPEGEDPGHVDPAAHALTLEDLERRRRALGAVNPLAAEECAEVAERIAEIEEQVADLEAAAASLHGHLQGLDDAVAEGFEEVFRAVRARFGEVVEVLFPGGEGRLVEVGDEDDEPGVEIQVVPAGKRPRSLALMSGGERSLVALAFCLAIATARPAPFYLLDEVEAALDDTNLRRLLALVRRLADRTQFLMITHQQPTVEIADTLFGVSMASDGMSQVVARRLDRGVEGTARPFVRRQLTAIRGGRA